MLRHADQAAGSRARPAAGPPRHRSARRVAGHQDRADLREGERHHGERDPAVRSATAPSSAASTVPPRRSAAAAATVASPARRDQRCRCLDAGGEVERVPEGEHARYARTAGRSRPPGRRRPGRSRAVAGCPAISAARRRAPARRAWSRAGSPRPRGDQRRTGAARASGRSAARVRVPDAGAASTTELVMRATFRPGPAAGAAAPGEQARPRRCHRVRSRRSS